jgi:AraC-like DNA-binding protein
MRTLDERATAEVAAPVLDGLMHALSGWSVPGERSMHPSIRQAVRILRARSASAMSADELASEVGLSTSRFLHLFKDEMGTPLRPYLQWLRIWHAFVAILRGRSATAAAAEAGFADAPHFNRVVRQYFGFAPLDLVRRADLQVELCLADPER